jgi:PAS domain S-box-containing protein
VAAQHGAKARSDAPESGRSATVKALFALAWLAAFAAVAWYVHKLSLPMWLFGLVAVVSLAPFVWEAVGAGRGARGAAERAEHLATLRAAADQADAPRAIIGPDGATLHANRAFVDVFRGADAGGDPIGAALGGYPEHIARFGRLCAEAQKGKAGEADFALAAGGVRRIVAAPLEGHPGHIVLRIEDFGPATAGMFPQRPEAPVVPIGAASAASAYGAGPAGATVGLDRFIEAAPIGVAVIDANGRLRQSNAAFRALMGAGEADLAGHGLSELFATESVQQIVLQIAAVAAGSETAPIEAKPLLRAEAAVELSVAAADRGPGAAGNGAGEAQFLLFGLDATEKGRLQSQMSQAHKMQAVGQLAGGIAHDFNNLLTAMIGYCDLLLQRHRPGEQSFADIMQIKQNANRAADLVRQLLAFSRQQTLKPKTLKLTDVLGDISHLLRRLVGSNIELQVVHARDIGFVRVDRTQLEQVIVNLVVNARDAMPDGGVIRVQTSMLRLAKPTPAGNETVAAGEWVQLDIIDQGVGIPPENLQRIFDPFFSTKEVGRGTGLGLSTVYGIVKQTGGHVLVRSEVGRGSVFTVLLPRHEPGADAEAEARQAAGEATRDLTGAGTILLVEDEDAVRAFSARALRNKGYTVMEARTGVDALDVLERSGGRAVELLITDVMMPQMDGPTLIRKVRERWPETKVICISGYAEESFRDKIGRWEDVWFLPKPYSLNQLAGLVKDAMARRP